jgi:hypothetical protein
MWALLFLTSGSAGFVWKLRRERAPKASNPFEDVAANPKSAVAVIVSTAGSLVRQSALTALGGVRQQALAAFSKTAEQRAPVPLTFLAALSRNFPVIFGTSFCTHLCWWSFGKLGWAFYKSTGNNITEEEKTRNSLEAGAHIVCFGIGAIG